MSQKSNILKKLSANLPDSKKTRQNNATKHLKQNKRGTTPTRTKLAHNNLIKLFITEAEKADATCQQLPSINEVPKAVENYITQQKLTNHICLSQQKEIRQLNWNSDKLQLTENDATDGLIGINKAHAGVAETGSLAFTSAADLRLSQNFLSASHIAILSAADIVACYEDIQENFTRHRGLIFITGPSRTGDIAQTIELGAHGALRLHVLII